MGLESTIWARLGVVSAVFAMWGCMGTPDADVDGLESADETDSAIIGGTPATSFPEAVLVNMAKNGQIVAACSGAVIAPKVVLTAGHCVNGFNGFAITAPFANNQKATAVGAALFDYTSTSETVEPSQHDVALIFLDKAISIGQYPKLKGTKLANGTKVVNVGRIDDGAFSNTQLFVSPSVSVSDAASVGFPFDYQSNEVIQSGDSGGPDFLAGSGTHTIVAVNSGAGGGLQVLARVDLLKSFITTQVNANGGFGNGGFVN